MKKQDLTKCNECGNVFETTQMLKAPSPFDPDDVLCACPKCKTPEVLQAICQVEGCKGEATCGKPTKHGYLHLCRYHDRAIK